MSKVTNCFLFLLGAHVQKPEVDIGGVNQTMPLDISGGTTPSEHDAPNSQSSHSGKSQLEIKSQHTVPSKLIVHRVGISFARLDSFFLSFLSFVCLDYFKKHKSRTS